WIVGQGLHPDPIAQNRPARKRTRRVNRDDADRLTNRAVMQREFVNERGFARAWRARHADSQSAPRSREDRLQNLVRGWGIVLDLGDGGGEGGGIARRDWVDK